MSDSRSPCRPRTEYIIYDHTILFTDFVLILGENERTAYELRKKLFAALVPLTLWCLAPPTPLTLSFAPLTFCCFWGRRMAPAGKVNRRSAALAAAAVVAAGLTSRLASAHPNCRGDFSPSFSIDAQFCPNDHEDGFCCNAQEESGIQAVYEAAGATGACADLYLEVGDDDERMISSCDGRTSPA